MSKFYTVASALALALSLSSVGHAAEIQAGDFFKGIEEGRGLSNEEALKIIREDKRLKDYADIMKAKAVAVLDTGKRYRCDCYDYLVKYESVPSKYAPQATFWINEVRIKQGQVEQ